MFERNYDAEVSNFFGDKFRATSTKTRFEVMIDYYSKAFKLNEVQTLEAYEKVFSRYLQGNVKKFDGYFAATCNSLRDKEYTPEQTQNYIERCIALRKDQELDHFILNYDAGERRTFAPSFGVFSKEHNEIAYNAAVNQLIKRYQYDDLAAALESFTGSELLQYIPQIKEGMEQNHFPEYLKLRFDKDTEAALARTMDNNPENCSKVLHYRNRLDNITTALELKDFKECLSGDIEMYRNVIKMSPEERADSMFSISDINHEKGVLKELRNIERAMLEKEKQINQPSPQKDIPFKM